MQAGLRGGGGRGLQAWGGRQVSAAPVPVQRHHPPRPRLCRSRLRFRCTCSNRLKWSNVVVYPRSYSSWSCADPAGFANHSIFHGSEMDTREEVRSSASPPDGVITGRQAVGRIWRQRAAASHVRCCDTLSIMTLRGPVNDITRCCHDLCGARRLTRPVLTLPCRRHGAATRRRKRSAGCCGAAWKTSLRSSSCCSRRQVSRKTCTIGQHLATNEVAGKCLPLRSFILHPSMQPCSCSKPRPSPEPLPTPAQTCRCTRRSWCGSS